MTATKLAKIRTTIEENDDDNTSETGQGSEVSENEHEQNKRSKNVEWANSIAKILRTDKPKGKSAIVLAKAKKINDIKEKPKGPGFEIVDEIKEEKPDPETLNKDLQNSESTKKRKDIINFRVKPSILDRDRERTLSKIATRGVVQLFNAVRGQQRDIKNKLKEAGPLERKQSKVLKNIDKRAFLDVLMGGERSKSQLVDGPVKEEMKREAKSENKTDAKWSVLREDFMLGSNMKDWDKQDSGDDNESPMEDLSDDDT